jgi:hypothetical protein
MSVRIAPNEFGNQELVMTIENNGLEEICVPFPILRFGEENAAQVVLTMADGTERTGFYIGARRGLNNDPGLSVSIPMQPKSSYTARTLLAGWGYYAPDLHRVEELLRRPGTLKLKVQIGRGQLPQEKNCYGVPRPPDGWPPGTFWHGTLFSNTLRFPLARMPTGGRDKKSGGNQ